MTTLKRQTAKLALLGLFSHVVFAACGESGGNEGGGGSSSLAGAAALPAVAGSNGLGVGGDPVATQGHAVRDCVEDQAPGCYEIVWRDTTSPFWTNSAFVGNVLTYTAKEMSKDNYFFGVRAVDKNGNKSLVSYPRPVR